MPKLALIAGCLCSRVAVAFAVLGAVALAFPNPVMSALYVAIVFGLPLGLVCLAVIALSMVGRGAAELACRCCRAKPGPDEIQ